MKRITKKKLGLQKETVKVLLQPLEPKTLQNVVGGGSIIDCATREL